MVKVEAISQFTLGRFDEVKNIIRYEEGNKLIGTIYKGDIFECDKDLADYLLGNNGYNRAFVKIIEYIPDEKPEIKFEGKEIKKPLKKRTSKK